MDTPSASSSSPATPPPPKIILPEFTLTEDSTPGDIQVYWEDLTAIAEQEQSDINSQLDCIKAELNTLVGKCSPEQRERKKILRQKEKNLKTIAYSSILGTFQTVLLTTLEEFTPRLLDLLRETELETEEEILEAAEGFWECLERPAIEHVGHTSLRDIAHQWYGEKNPTPTSTIQPQSLLSTCAPLTIEHEDWRTC
jgi:hypothetical protein